MLNRKKEEVTDLSTLLPTLPGGVSQKGEGVRNPDAVVKSKKEKLGEFKFSWKLLEELPGTVKEERKHWGLRRENSLGHLQASEKGRTGTWNRTLRRSGIKTGIESKRGSRLTHLSFHLAQQPVQTGFESSGVDYIIFSPSFL